MGALRRTRKGSASSNCEKTLKQSIERIRNSIAKDERKIVSLTISHMRLNRKMEKAGEALKADPNNRTKRWAFNKAHKKAMKYRNSIRYNKRTIERLENFIKKMKNMCEFVRK